MNDYFEIREDVRVPERWHLGSPTTRDGSIVDPRQFCQGRSVRSAEPLTLKIRRRGNPLDFTFADFSLPVVRRTLAAALEQLASGDIELIPVSVEGSTERFTIVNVLKVIDCLDESRSEFLKWSAEDGRPDKLEQFRQVSKLVVDPSKILDARIFRVAGWKVSLVVSAGLRTALRGDPSGVVFAPVA